MNQFDPTQAHFCTRCGEQLHRKAKPAGFDSETGDKLYYVLYVCPNRRLWFHSRWYMGELRGVFPWPHRLTFTSAQLSKERKPDLRPTLPAGLDEITCMLDAGYNIYITRAGTSVVGVYVRNERQLCIAHGHHPGLAAAIEAAYGKTPKAHKALVANLREAIE